MSHTVSLTTRLKDTAALRDACLRLDLPDPVEVRDFQMFDSNRVSGTKISLPDWRYPVVVDAEGCVHYDNYNGDWGDMDKLDQLYQMYGVSAARAKAKEMGCSFSETSLENGDIECVLTQAVGIGEEQAYA